jgi:hypothetical protein
MVKLEIKLNLHIQERNKILTLMNPVFSLRMIQNQF